VGNADHSYFLVGDKKMLPSTNRSLVHGTENIALGCLGRVIEGAKK
jgi:hypothetical protein